MRRRIVLIKGAPSSEVETEKDCIVNVGRSSHELPNEVSSADLMLPSRSTFLKEVEMVYSLEERFAIEQGESYDTSFLQ
jgi:hypothetical protein